MLYLIPSLLAGYLTKICDDYSEQKNKQILFSFLFSSLYAFAIILCGLIQPVLIPLIAGVVVGNIFANKIDTREHLLAVILIIGFYLFNFQIETIWIFFIFVLTSFFDETLHEIGSKFKKEYLESRFITPFIAFVISYVLWDFSFVLFMVLFDIGYRLAERKMFIK